MPRSVKELQDAIAASSREVAPLAQRYVEGGLEGDDLTQFRTRTAALETLYGELSDAQRAEQESAADRAAATRAMDANRHYNQPAGNRASGLVPGDAQGRTTEQRDGAPTTETRSMGQQFVESDQFREYREQGVGRGGSSKPVSIDTRALVTSTTVTEMILPNRVPGIYEPGRVELNLRSALPNGRTDSNLIEFVREATQTNNAAEVAEATALDGVGLTGGVKPESGFTLEADSAPVRTVAHLMYVTRQALDDMAGLQSYIDAFLRRGLDERIDKQLLIGNGTAPNLRGLNNVTGLIDLNGAYFTTGWPIVADRIRRAITRVRLGGRGRASLIVMNPADVETLELTKTSVETGVTVNQYAMPNGGPFGNGALATIWGRPIVESEDQTAGQATVLDASAAMVMSRMDQTMFITDSNRDLFERNILTILVEERLAFPIFYPGRIAKVALTATA